MKKILALLAVALASTGIAFAQAPAKKPADAAKPAATKPAADSTKPAAPAADAKKTEKIDINSASEKELATLPGIGEARSKAIVKGRPYKGKDELVQKKILSQSVYDKIKDDVIAKQK
ncbi:MAG TPA: helix-hairpin-helix domain-containing protein [Usitatibacter sp.]|jgi:DNA uptake protein ComE-like DNA-binding protein|nr:helix-hairpin-helix domain-containing protein [Usitatibacter sp.]